MCVSLSVGGELTVTKMMPPPLTLIPFSHPNNLPSPSSTPMSSSSSSSLEQIQRQKIIDHPHFHRLLLAYVNCRKIGAPAEVAAMLDERCAAATAAAGGCGGSEDPALNQFMEAYCEMLMKYEEELLRSLQEATLFLATFERHLFRLSERNGEEVEGIEEEDKVKCEIMRKYSGYLGGLKQELMMKKKRNKAEKLPKQASQHLLNWWATHYQWPYPSEADKIALGECTGLEQKQIKNWFINQRKRHWKPSQNLISLN